MRSIKIDPDGIGTAMLNKVEQALGRTVNTNSPLPWLPQGDHRLEVDRGWSTEHICRSEPIIHLPSVLVFDCQVYFRSRCQRMGSLDGFEPYHTGPVMVVHDNVCLPDLRWWRYASPMEAICCIAEYPELGSVRCEGRYFGGCGQHGSAQAYVQPESRTVVLDTRGTEKLHHMMFVRTHVYQRGGKLIGA